VKLILEKGKIIVERLFEINRGSRSSSVGVKFAFYVRDLLSQVPRQGRDEGQTPFDIHQSSRNITNIISHTSEAGLIPRPGICLAASTGKAKFSLDSKEILG
jgi:hypothetical protein